MSQRLFKQLNRNWAIWKRQDNVGRDYFVAIDNRDQIIEPIIDSTGYFYIESSPSWKLAPKYVREKIITLNKKAGFKHSFDN